MDEMIERVAKAIYDKFEDRPAYAQMQMNGIIAEECARAAIEAMRVGHTLEMQVAGMEALCLFNIEKDGPAKPHDECKTPDDWMGRGANIAGRMQSGEGVSRVFSAMIDSALADPS